MPAEKDSMSGIARSMPSLEIMENALKLFSQLGTNLSPFPTMHVYTLSGFFTTQKFNQILYLHLHQFLAGMDQ